MLTDICREIATAHAQDDPLECGQQWGMIQNRNVKVDIIIPPGYYSKLTDLQRRTGARPPPAQAAPEPKTKPESTVPAKRPLEKSAPAKQPDSKVQEPKSQPTSASDSQSSSKPAAKPAPKREKSDLFSSFAKAKPKQKTSKPAESVGSIIILLSCLH